MTTFDTAKIRSIDRTKGRIELSMRNGLVSVGTYPYDIATLREGMSVLIGKVDNSHVILNQVENVPRLGTSYSVRRPITPPPPPVITEVFTLDFEGDNGSITIVDGIGSIVPSYRNNCAISSDYFYNGISSLKLNAGVLGEEGDDAELKYHDYWGMYPGDPILFPDTFEFRMTVLLPTTNMYGLEVDMFDGEYLSDAGIYFYSWYDDDTSKFITNIYIYDRQGSEIFGGNISVYLLIGAWNTFVLTAGSDFIEVKVNNVVVVSETGLIGNPLSGLQDLYFWESTYDDPVYIDSLYIKEL